MSAQPDFSALWEFGVHELNYLLDQYHEPAGECNEPGIYNYYENHADSTLLQSYLAAPAYINQYDSYSGVYGPFHESLSLPCQPLRPDYPRHTPELYQEALGGDDATSYTPEPPTPGTIDATASSLPAQLVNLPLYEPEEVLNVRRSSYYEPFNKSEVVIYNDAVPAVETFNYHACAKQRRSRHELAAATRQLEEPQTYKHEATDSYLAQPCTQLIFPDGAQSISAEPAALELEIPPFIIPSQPRRVEVTPTKQEQYDTLLPTNAPKPLRAPKSRAAPVTVELPYPTQASIVTPSQSAQPDTINPSLLLTEAACGLGKVMYSPFSMQPMSASLYGPVPSGVPRVKKRFKRGTAVACLFCRKRKIACGGSVQGSSDKTCIQCSRRNQKCEYPPSADCSYMFREVPDDSGRMIHIMPEDGA